MPQHARLCWNHLAGKAHFKDILTTERLQIIDKRIDSVAATQLTWRRCPKLDTRRLPHRERGDRRNRRFRVDRLQGVRIGRGPEDIAFMYLRVNHPDGRVPRTIC